MSKPSFMSEARTKHFIVVHPKVVRETGSANNALVYIRMGWRCEELTSSTWEGPDGTIWWTAGHSVIAEETGLNVEQVRHALKQLRDAGLVEEYDFGKGRSKGYATLAAPSDISDTPVSDDSDTPSDISDTPDSEVSDISRSLLLIELEASGGENTNTGDVFEKAWSHWPKKTEKKVSRERFERALETRPQLPDEVIAFGDAYAAAVTSIEFVPALCVWINRERWSDPLPVPRSGGKPSTIDIGREADAILRARQEQRDSRMGVTA